MLGRSHNADQTQCIYRFKGSIVQSTITKKNSLRYFSREELTDLFQLDDATVSSTQQELHRLHAHQRHMDSHLEQHIKFLTSIGVYGISDHDLLFSKLQTVESTPEARHQARRAVRNLYRSSDEQQDDDDNDEDNGAGDNPVTPKKKASRTSREKNGIDRQRHTSDDTSSSGRPTPRESLDVDTALNTFVSATTPVRVYARTLVGKKPHTNSENRAFGKIPLTPQLKPRTKMADALGPKSAVGSHLYKKQRGKENEEPRASSSTPAPKKRLFS